ncbi:MAG: serine/threonine protein phosphatase, partial [Terriglobus roseus]|nr:serine/threonine protein phosphatase [Terriglobus roseus]
HDYADYTDDEEDEFFSGTDYQQDLDFWKKRGTAWVEETRQRVPKPVRRVLIVCSVIAVILWVVFIFFLNPWLKEHAFWNNVYSSALVASKNDGMPTYGSQLELTFENMIQVATLDKTHLPHGKRPGRLIFIGDVHGCKAELVHLLSKTAFDKHRDHVILTGDIINKGPDTPGVVDLARSLGASCVRGNHEDKVLLLRDELARHGTLHHPSKEQLAHEAKLPASEARARKTARQLSDEQAAWLAACPVILRIGDLPGMGSVIAVHAGLAPGVALTKQDPFQVMNMRSMDPETRVPSENRELEKWDKVWAEWQERAKKGDRAVVVYGHDSKRGLNVKGKWAKGLDSGCVNGEKLTALVVDAEGKQEIVQVKCSEDNRG